MHATLYQPNLSLDTKRVDISAHPLYGKVRLVFVRLVILLDQPFLGLFKSVGKVYLFAAK